MSNQTVEFLGIIETRLAHLPNSEVEKVISYYNESIEDRLEDGMTEEEAIKSFGTIDNIVSDIETEISFYTVVKEKIDNESKVTVVNGRAIHEIGLDNEVVEYTFEQNFGEIHFETTNRGVVVKKSPDDKIHLVVYQNKYEYYEVIETENLTVKYVEERGFFGKKLSFRNENTQEAELYIPYNENQKLFVSATNDDINVTDIRLNTLSLSNKNGDIQASNVMVDSIKVKNINGDIGVSNVNSNDVFDIEGKNGDIEVANLKSNSVKVYNKNGDIKVVNVFCNNLVDVNNENGDIEVINVMGDSVKIYSKNGDIEITNTNSNNALDISNRNADIKVKNVKADNIKFENKSGDIRISEICSRNNIEISNSEADIKFRDLEFEGKLIVECSNASVTGNVKGVESDYTFEVTASNDKAVVNGKRVSEVFGSGSKLIKINCSNDSINIKTK